MVWIILTAVLLIFLVPSFAALMVIYFTTIIEPPVPTPMALERTHRGVPQTCEACSADCFANDWVCLCECHEGHVPLHRIKERKTILAALGRASGGKSK